MGAVIKEAEAQETDNPRMMYFGHEPTVFPESLDYSLDSFFLIVYAQ
jgi:hypothetical protein